MAGIKPTAFLEVTTEDRFYDVNSLLGSWIVVPDGVNRFERVEESRGESWGDTITG